jgi:hypothetical protein
MAFVQKPGATPEAAAAGRQERIAYDNAQLAGDKRAAGVGVFNRIMSMFKKPGSAWDDLRGAGPPRDRALGALYRSET